MGAVIDFSVAHSARVWDYWLGGRDNHAADRMAGDAVAAVYPDIVRVAKETRGLLARAVRHLAGEVGVRQFLDIGAGLPTVLNTHEVAHAVAPDAQVVYVDNDPLVATYARAWLADGQKEGVHYLEGDLRQPGVLMDDVGGVLDLEQPVAVIFLEVLGHVASLAEIRSILAKVMSAVPSGSFLVLGDTADTGPEIRRAARAFAATGTVPYHLRTVSQIEECFTALDLVPPGVVPFPNWRPDPDTTPAPALTAYGGIARKP